MKKLTKGDLYCIKPYMVRQFNEPIQDVQWHNKDFVSFQLSTKVYVYQKNSLAHKFGLVYLTPPLDSVKNKTTRKHYHIHFNKDGTEISKVAYLIKEKVP